MTTSPPAPRPAAPGQRFGATDLGLVIMSLIWGINYSVVKTGLRTLSPLAFYIQPIPTAMKSLIAALLLAALFCFGCASSYKCNGQRAIQTPMGRM